jgi:hypothetical protein
VLRSIKARWKRFNPIWKLLILVHRSARSSSSQQCEVAGITSRLTSAIPSASSITHVVSMVQYATRSIRDCADLGAVAITRAKALLIVVGDPATLSLDPLWRRFLTLIYRNGGWAGDDIPWDVENDIEDDQLEETTRIGVLDNMQQLAERIEAQTLDAVFVEPDDGDDDWLSV